MLPLPGSIYARRKMSNLIGMMSDMYHSDTLTLGQCREKLPRRPSGPTRASTSISITPDQQHQCDDSQRDEDPRVVLDRAGQQTKCQPGLIGQRLKHVWSPELPPSRTALRQ